VVTITAPSATGSSSARPRTAGAVPGARWAIITADGSTARAAIRGSGRRTDA